MIKVLHIALAALVTSAQGDMPMARSADAKRVTQREIDDARVLGPSIYPSVEALGRSSDAIVVASEIFVGLRELRSAGNAKDVETITKLEIHQVVKGGIAAGQVVTLGQPGGHRRDSDGQIILEILPAHYLGLVPGIPHLLFLKKSAEGVGYRTVGGPQGMYQVFGDRLVAADRRPVPHVGVELDGLTLDAAKRLVRERIGVH